MSAGMMIQAEGITWPLETFLDAHRYIRTNRMVPDFHILTGQVDALMISGEVRSGMELRTMPWHDCLAVRVPDGSMHLAYCHGCDATIVELRVEQFPRGVMRFSQELCRDCEMDCY